MFLSESAKLNVKIVNNDVVLFKSIDKENSYSESGIIDRKTGELVHEITKNNDYREECGLRVLPV